MQFEMGPTPNPEPLSAQPWFEEFLAGKGFHRVSPESFSNSRASIHVQGSHLVADPGTNGKRWSADLTGGDRPTITMLLEQVLKMRPFQSDADLAAERAEKQRIERALGGIAATIKECPDTGGGVQLRRFLWSLYNGHHLINLWRMTSVLDSKRAEWVSEVFAGALNGVLKEDDIKRALLAAGEMERWDEVQPRDEQLEKLSEAESQIEAVLRTLPPSSSHTDLARAREALWNAKEALDLAKKPPRE